MRYLYNFFPQTPRRFLVSSAMTAAIVGIIYLQGSLVRSQNELINYWSNFSEDDFEVIVAELSKVSNILAEVAINSRASTPFPDSAINAFIIASGIVMFLISSSLVNNWQHVQQMFIAPPPMS